MPVFIEFNVTFAVVPAAAGAPSVDPAAMLPVVLFEPYVRQEEDDDEWVADQNRRLSRCNDFLSELIHTGCANSHGDWDHEYIVRVFAKVAKAFPVLTFTVECGDSDRGYPSRHWFSNGAHTHSQKQTLQWAEKVAIAAAPAAAE